MLRCSVSAAITLGCAHSLLGSVYPPGNVAFLGSVCLSGRVMCVLYARLQVCPDQRGVAGRCRAP
jgi:hypothetical protein